MRITLEIGNINKAKALLDFLKTLGYVKSIKVDKDHLLNEEDWGNPGRKATAEEHEVMAKAMEYDDSGVDSDQVFEKLFEKYPE